MMEVDCGLDVGCDKLLRSVLSLAMIYQKPFRMVNIKSRSTQSGLSSEQLACVMAAQHIAHADVQRVKLGSNEFQFYPTGLLSGRFVLSGQNIWSAAQIWQTVFPALVLADGPSHLSINGVTHSPHGSTFEKLAFSLWALAQQWGVKGELTVSRHGYYPDVQGLMTCDIVPMRPKSLSWLSAKTKRIDRILVRTSNVQSKLALNCVDQLCAIYDLPEHVVFIEPTEALPPQTCLVQVVIVTDYSERVLSFYPEIGQHVIQEFQSFLGELEKYMKDDSFADPDLMADLLIPLSVAQDLNVTVSHITDSLRRVISWVERFSMRTIDVIQKENYYLLSIKF